MESWHAHNLVEEIALVNLRDDITTAGCFAHRDRAKMCDRISGGTHGGYRIASMLERERKGRGPHEALAVGHRGLLHEALNMSVIRYLILIASFGSSGPK
jgi:hypothetical protein